MPDTPPASPSDPVGLLRARVTELEAVNARLRQAAADRDELAAAQLAVRDAQIAALAAKVADLERCLAKDSGTSSKPPSSDSPYTKKPKDRSLRGRSGRKPGKQPGAESSALEQSGHPDHTVECGPAACGCCGTGLSDAPAAGMQKRQVFEAAPPPPPEVTEYQVQAKQCPECGEVSIGLAPDGVTGRVQYGPRVHASTALAVCANYLPVARAAKLVAALTGVHVSAGFTAGIRGKAAARLGPFTDRVKELPGAAAVLYADETPARTAGKLHYVHVACTEFLTAMHTGDRTKEAIDSGGILRAIRARSSATGTPATTTWPVRCMPGAARTDFATWPGCTASTRTGRSGPAPWPTCSSTPTPPRPPPATPGRPASPALTWPASRPATAAPSPRASPITSARAPGWARTGCGWPAGSATTRT